MGPWNLSLTNLMPSLGVFGILKLERGTGRAGTVGKGSLL